MTSYKNRLLFFLLLFIVVSSCSSPVENDLNNISLSKDADNLIISNDTSNKIFIFAVEVNYAALINWSPHFNDPSVRSGKSIKINFDNITNGVNEKVKSGDRVVVYWWDDNHEDHTDILAKGITL